MLDQEILVTISSLKKCLFGETNIVKTSDKEKWLYCGYGIVFDEAG